MIRYRYLADLVPPAPFVHVSLRCPATGSERTNLPAQVDSAADRTVVPDTVVAALQLVQDGRAVFQGFGSQLVELPLYLLAVTVHDLPPVLVRVTLGEHEPYVLLGRDVLNRLRPLLDGPQLMLEIG
jgi:hypothetical protein